MAIWTQIYGTDLWSVAVTKINNVIGSYNNWSGGTENQRKVKASATDFDTAWCDPENKINSSTSFNLGTLLVGDSKSIALPYHSYSAEGNIAIKAYSVANPLNYIIGNITAIPDNQNITVTIFEKGGSGTQTDMVVIPYGMLDNEHISIDTTTFPNAIFSTAPVISNGTLTSMQVSLIRNGENITLSGYCKLTATNSSFDRRFILGTLQNDFLIKNGDTKVIIGASNIGFTKLISSVYYPFSIVGYIQNKSSLVASPSDNILKFEDIIETFPVVLNTGEVYYYNFSITYIRA
jgi:hypothetical protein